MDSAEAIAGNFIDLLHHTLGTELPRLLDAAAARHFRDRIRSEYVVYRPKEQHGADLGFYENADMVHVGMRGPNTQVLFQLDDPDGYSALEFPDTKQAWLDEVGHVPIAGARLDAALRVLGDDEAPGRCLPTYMIDAAVDFTIERRIRQASNDLFGFEVGSSLCYNWCYYKLTGLRIMLTSPRPTFADEFLALMSRVLPALGKTTVGLFALPPRMALFDHYMSSAFMGTPTLIPEGARAVLKEFPSSYSDFRAWYHSLPPATRAFFARYGNREVLVTDMLSDSHVDRFFPSGPDGEVGPGADG